MCLAAPEKCGLRSALATVAADRSAKAATPGKHTGAGASRGLCGRFRTHRANGALLAGSGRTRLSRRRARNLAYDARGEFKGWTDRPCAAVARHERGEWRGLARIVGSVVKCRLEIALTGAIPHAHRRDRETRR